MACKLILFVLLTCLSGEYLCEVFRFKRGGNEARMSPPTTSSMADILPDFPSLCPYTTFCKSPALKENITKERTSCCQKCSCDPKCYEVGNCCPDTLFAQAGKLKYPCTDLSVLNDRSILFGTDINAWYHMIDRCPDMFSNLSHYRCYQPMNLQDLVAVSDPANGKVYKNRHCAICNGVDNYLNWKLKLFCADIFSHSFQTTEERDMYIFQNRKKCRVYPVPPDEKTAEISRCYPESQLRRKCNVTGSWDVYDKNIEDACLLNRQTQNVIYSEQVSKNRIVNIKYANVYCFLCNSHKNAQRNDLCLYDHTIEGRMFSKKSFAVIFDTRSDEDSVENYPCKQMEIWDPFRRSFLTRSYVENFIAALCESNVVFQLNIYFLQKFCRSLTCPSATIPWKGSCKSLISGSEGYSIGLNFEVSLGSQNLTGELDTLLYFLEKRIAPMLGFGCRVSSTFLVEGRISSVIIFELVMYSTDICPPDIILSSAQKISLQNEINVKYKTGSKEFQAKLDLVFGSFTEDSEILSFNVNDDIPPHIIIDSSIIHYCPRINMTQKEVYSLGLNDSLSTISGLSDDKNTEFYSVCVDSYFEAQQASSGTLPVKHCGYLDKWYKLMFLTELAALIFLNCRRLLHKL